MMIFADPYNYIWQGPGFPSVDARLFRHMLKSEVLINILPPSDVRPKRHFESGTIRRPNRHYRRPQKLLFPHRLKSRRSVDIPANIRIAIDFPPPAEIHRLGRHPPAVRRAPDFPRGCNTPPSWHFRRPSKRA